MPHNFWMINCNEANFNITRSLGFTRQALKAEYRRKVQRVEPGDRIIYYVTGIRVFAATATVTEGYRDAPSSQPWLNEGKTAWPYRIGIKPAVILESAQYIDAGLLAYRLEYLRKWAPEDWHLAFQGNLHLLSRADFALLETEMRKLRYGREETLRQVEIELAEEEERNHAQRERRRRPAERRRNSPADAPVRPDVPARPDTPVRSDTPARPNAAPPPGSNGHRRHDVADPAAAGRAVAAALTTAAAKPAAAGADQDDPPPAAGNRSRRNRRTPRNNRAGAGRPPKPQDDHGADS